MKRLLTLLALTVSFVAAPLSAKDAIPTYGFTIVHTYPHDTGAYTEGFFFLDGAFYEGTGEIHHSSIRKVNLDTGEVVQHANLDNDDYGEGIINWKDKVLLTF